MKYFTGIGSRKTPPEYLKVLRDLSEYLSLQSLVLRSGHAQGADRACEAGAGGNADIFLPWAGYGVVPYKDDPGLRVIGKEYVPTMKGYPNHLRTIQKTCRGLGRDFDRLSQGVQKLLFRNVFQIYGPDWVLSELVICYHEGSGGTLYAVEMAEKEGIPVINVKGRTYEDCLEEIKEILSEDS